MPDLADGESIQVKGSGSAVYTIRNVGGAYSCSCPAWRNQSTEIESRTCKHIRRLRGDELEIARVGDAAAAPPRAKLGSGDDQESTQETPVLLAESWDGVLDVTGWWLSEKLDGVRAYWDGKQFLSRQGNRYVAPPWFTQGLPEVPLDGELWLGRKQFQRAVSIVRRQDQSEHWRGIRFVVFDAPTQEQPFEQRMEFVNDWFASSGPEFAAVHTHERCGGVSHLKDELARIESLGGEGLMLREPASRYVIGRSSTLLKVKTFHDAEAEVVGHQPGAGRHKGRMGALVVRLPDATEFSVGTGFSDAERERPPSIGARITFRYQELSDGGVPRFPSFVGVRKDEPSTSPKKSAPSKAGEQSETAGPSPTAPRNAAGMRRFVFQDGKSEKFWEIAVDGTNVAVRFGRIGTSGQTNAKSFPSIDAARKHADELIQEKTKKGYEEKP
jgi:DNA ligase-1